MESGPEPAEGAAVVPDRRRHPIQHFAEPMRTRIEDAGAPSGRADGERGAEQDHHGRDEDDQRRHLHLVGLDLLAEIFRRAAHHEPGDEHGDQGEHQHAVEARPDPAEHDLTELDQPHRNEATERREAVVHGVHRAVGRRRRGRGPDGGVDDAEARLLPLHVAARPAATRAPGRHRPRPVPACRAARARSPR